MERIDRARPRARGKRFKRGTYDATTNTMATSQASFK